MSAFSCPATALMSARDIRHFEARCSICCLDLVFPYKTFHFPVSINSFVWIFYLVMLWLLFSLLSLDSPFIPSSPSLIIFFRFPAKSEVTTFPMVLYSTFHSHRIVLPWNCWKTGYEMGPIFLQYYFYELCSIFEKRDKCTLDMIFSH